MWCDHEACSTPPRACTRCGDSTEHCTSSPMPATLGAQCLHVGVAFGTEPRTPHTPRPVKSNAPRHRASNDGRPALTTGLCCAARCEATNELGSVRGVLVVCGRTMKGMEASCRCRPASPSRWARSRPCGCAGSRSASPIGKRQAFREFRICEQHV